MPNQMRTTECRKEWLSMPRNDSRRNHWRGDSTVRIVPHICIRPKSHEGSCECVCGATDDE